VERGRLTHHLNFTGTRGHTSRLKAVGGCSEGLLVCSGNRLTLADFETVKPIRIVARDFTDQIGFVGSPSRPHVFLAQSYPERKITTIDAGTGKELNQWEAAADDESTRNMNLQRYLVVTQDGKHLFTLGRPAHHFKIDDQGRLELQEAMPVEGEPQAMLPTAVNAGPYIAFKVLKGAMKLPLYDANSPEAPLLGTASHIDTWFYDPGQDVFWSSTNNDSVAFDRDGNEVSRIPEDAYRKIEGWIPGGVTSMPSTGGKMVHSTHSKVVLIDLKPGDG
jgi:hypothetical protein